MEFKNDSIKADPNPPDKSSLSPQFQVRLPWGAVKEKQPPPIPQNNSNFTSDAPTIGGANNFFQSTNTTQQDIVTLKKEEEPKNIKSDLSKSMTQKPGEYVMNLILLQFIQISSKKFEQTINGDRRDKRLRDCIFVHRHRESRLLVLLDDNYQVEFVNYIKMLIAKIDRKYRILPYN